MKARLIIIFFCVLISSLLADQGVLLEKKTALDRKIKADIVGEISNVLSRDEFAVIVNAQLEESELRDNSNNAGPDQSISDILGIDDNQSANDLFPEEGSLIGGTPAASADSEKLPGFDFYTPSDTREKIGDLSPVRPPKKVYTMKSLEVQVIYDQNIPNNTITSLQRALQNKIQTGYGVKGELVFLPGTLKQAPIQAGGNEPAPQQPQAANNQSEALERLVDFIVNNFWIVLGGILLSILFFIILIFIFLILMGRKRKTEEKTENLISPDPERAPSGSFKLKDPSSSQRDLSLDEDYWKGLRMQRESELVNKFSKDPLLGRKFFVSLRQEQKNEIMSAMSPSIRELFLPFTPYSEKDEQDPNLTLAERYKKEAKILEKYDNELTLFKQATSLQAKGDFGRLSFLDPFELKNVLDSLSNEELGYLMEFLPREHLRKVLASFTDVKRKEIILHSKVKLSKEKLENLAFKVNKEIDAIANSLLFPKSQRDEIFDIIFSQSNNSKDLLDGVRGDEDLYEKFQKYNITFDDFLKERNVELLKNLVDDLENEEMALGLMSIEQERRENYLSLLSSARREVVEDLMLTYNPVEDREKIQNGRFKIIDRYRQLKSLG